MTGDQASSSAGIRLDQFLKVQRVVVSGGQAKIMIQSGEVLVNGRVETCRGRQLAVGDVVTVADREFLCGSKED